MLQLAERVELLRKTIPLMQAAAVGRHSKKLPKWLDKLNGVTEPSSKRKPAADAQEGASGEAGDGVRPAACMCPRQHEQHESRTCSLQLTLKRLGLAVGVYALCWPGRGTTEACGAMRRATLGQAGRHAVLSTPVLPMPYCLQHLHTSRPTDS